MAVNLNTFVHAAGLLPGGFTGITLLIQEVFAKYLNIKIPFVLFYWGLNLVPALICFRYEVLMLQMMYCSAVFLVELLTELQSVSVY